MQVSFINNFLNLSLIFLCSAGIYAADKDHDLQESSVNGSITQSRNHHMIITSAEKLLEDLNQEITPNAGYIGDLITSTMFGGKQMDEFRRFIVETDAKTLPKRIASLRAIILELHTTDKDIAMVDHNENIMQVLKKVIALKYDEKEILTNEWNEKYKKLADLTRKEKIHSCLTDSLTKLNTSIIRYQTYLENHKAMEIQ